MRSRGMVGVLAVLVVILAGRAVTLAQKQAAPFAMPQPQLGELRPDGNRTKWREPGKVEARGTATLANDPSQAIPSLPPPDALPSPGNAEVLDPMDAVDAFLRRNRQEADASIEALTREAETLRNRLQKVDAALARWQTVSSALNSEPPPSADSNRLEPQLEAIKPPEAPAKEPDSVEPPKVPVQAPGPVVQPPPTLDPNAT